MQFQSGEWADVPTVPQNTVRADPVQRRLSVVIPFIESELSLVQNLLNRSIELCGQIPRYAFLVPFKGLKVDEILETAKRAFDSVGIIQDAEGKISDWQEGLPMRSAAGPNSFFRQAAWFFYLHKRYPAWLWLEPDCMPVTSRWFFELEQEYFEVGRPFLGVKMRISDSKEYMNGVGIYPWNSIQYAPLLVQSAMWEQYPQFEVGFDVAGGTEVLSKAHMTRKIQLELKQRDDLTIRPETVLVHGRNNLSRGGQIASVSSSHVAHDPAQNDLGGDAICCQRPTVNDAVDTMPLVPIVVASNAEPTFDPNGAASQTKQDGSEYGLISREIRRLVELLTKLWGDQPHRKVLIVKELRKARLVPKHFR